jgi:hypothetical protein
MIWNADQTLLEMCKQSLAVNTKIYETEGDLGTFFQNGNVTCTLNCCTVYSYCSVFCITI